MNNYTIEIQSPGETEWTPLCSLEGISYEEALKEYHLKCDLLSCRVRLLEERVVACCTAKTLRGARTAQ